MKLGQTLQIFFSCIEYKCCDTRNLRGDYHTLGFNQKSKLSSVETQNN